MRCAMPSSAISPASSFAGSPFPIHEWRRRRMLKSTGSGHHILIAPSPRTPSTCRLSGITHVAPVAQGRQDLKRALTILRFLLKGADGPLLLFRLFAQIQSAVDNGQEDTSGNIRGIIPDHGFQNLACTGQITIFLCPLTQSPTAIDVGGV